MARRAVKVRQLGPAAERTRENVDQVERATRADREADKGRLVLLSGSIAAGNAAATYEHPIVVLSRPIQVTGVSVAPADALAAHSANHAVLSACAGDGTGAFPIPFARIITRDATDGGTGDWVAWRPVVFRRVGARSLPVGTLITLRLEKEGTGVAVPIHSWTLTYKELD